MAKNTEVILRNAVKQIKAGKSNKARKQLVELLRREPDNAQAWYLLSFTLDDLQRQQYALLQALRVTPDFEKARTRLAKLRGESVPTPTPTAFTEPENKPDKVAQETPVPAFIEEKEEEPRKDVFSFNDSPNGEEIPKRRSNLMAVLLGIIVIALLIFAAWIFLPSLTLTRPTATPVASRTLPPTWTPSAIPPSATLTNTPVPTSTPTPEVTLSTTVEGSAAP